MHHFMGNNAVKLCVGQLYIGQNECRLYRAHKHRRAEKTAFFHLYRAIYMDFRAFMYPYCQYDIACQPENEHKGKACRPYIWQVLRDVYFTLYRLWCDGFGWNFGYGFCLSYHFGRLQDDLLLNCGLFGQIYVYPYRQNCDDNQRQPHIIMPFWRKAPVSQLIYCRKNQYCRRADKHWNEKVGHGLVLLFA